eukprot:1531015-Alexandrium_andersonii.AAC.1
MSASLVGSEMCIRDRRKNSSVPGMISEARWAASLVRLMSFMTRAGKCWSCLLYTSDAADDM